MTRGLVGCRRRCSNLSVGASLLLQLRHAAHERLFTACRCEETRFTAPVSGDHRSAEAVQGDVETATCVLETPT